MLTAFARGKPLLFSGMIILLLWVALILYVPLAVVMGLLGLAIVFVLAVAWFFVQ